MQSETFAAHYLFICLVICRASLISLLTVLPKGFLASRDAYTETPVQTFLHLVRNIMQSDVVCLTDNLPALEFQHRSTGMQQDTNWTASTAAAKAPIMIYRGSRNEEKRVATC